MSEQERGGVLDASGALVFLFFSPLMGRVVFVGGRVVSGVSSLMLASFCGFFLLDLLASVEEGLGLVWATVAIVGWV